MSDERPDPLVPAEVDLRDFAFMPLDVRRLRDSRLVSTRKSDEVVAAILLWSASWHQQPASSVPDDEQELSNLAGYGRGVREFKRIFDGALYGFIMCADGRWYHPVVAEKAADGWNAKIKEEHRRACDRCRKENKEREKRSDPPLPMPAMPPLLRNFGSDRIPRYRYADSAGNEIVSGGIVDTVLRNSVLKGEGREGTVKGQGQGFESVPPSGGSRTSRKTGLPAGFEISERVRRWAAEKGHGRLEEHFDNFVSKVKAKGYKYVDWDEALMGAIRDNWARLTMPASTTSKGSLHAGVGADGKF